MITLKQPAACAENVTRRLDMYGSSIIRATILREGETRLMTRGRVNNMYAGGRRTRYIRDVLRRGGKRVELAVDIFPFQNTQRSELRPLPSL